MVKKPQRYRDFIDEMVRTCHEGQGRIASESVLSGVWNRNANEIDLPEQHQINLLLRRLSGPDRELLAGLLSKAFEGGVFNTLRALEDFEIEPFIEGYEGSPYNDFVGRLDDWPWPKS